MPPHLELDGDAIAAVLTETVSAEKHEDTFAVLAQMDGAHPKFPHWYLPWFGVDAAVQGRGLGGELMRHCLRIVDEDSSARVSRFPQSPQRIVLRAPRVRGHRRGPGWNLPADRLHAEGRAVEGW